MKWVSYIIGATAVVAFVMLAPSAGWSGMGGSGGMMGGSSIGMGGGSGMMGGSGMNGQMSNQGSMRNPTGRGGTIDRMMNSIEHFLGQGTETGAGNRNNGIAVNGNNTARTGHASNSRNHAGGSLQSANR